MLFINIIYFYIFVCHNGTTDERTGIYFILFCFFIFIFYEEEQKRIKNQEEKEKMDKEQAKYSSSSRLNRLKAMHGIK